MTPDKLLIKQLKMALAEARNESELRRKTIRAACDAACTCGVNNACVACKIGHASTRNALRCCYCGGPAEGRYSIQEYARPRPQLP